MNPKSQAVLSHLRGIIRTIDLNERDLSRACGLTLPQLLTLQTLQAEQPMSTGVLAQRMDLAQATVTSILDRLESRGLVIRLRGTDDKRKVWVKLTDQGRLAWYRHRTPCRSAWWSVSCRYPTGSNPCCWVPWNCWPN